MEPGYILEVMPNISTMQLLVYAGPSPCHPPALKLRVQELELSLGTELEQTLLLSLPRAVKTDSATLKQVGSHLIIRISLEQQANASTLEDPPTPTPSKGDFQRLVCRYGPMEMELSS